VLGPQRRPTLGQVVRTLEPDAPLATVTAGWQEREPDDGELRRILDRPTANLGLYARWLDVLDRDREFAAAQREHDAVLDELRHAYLVQLDAALAALYAIARDEATRPRVRAAALADAQAVVRLVDDRHLTRVARAREDFDGAWSPGERDVIAGHRDEVREILERVRGLVVAGGHVGVLLSVLRLFTVPSPIPATVIAWSAGAMALTERVLLFHDHPPQGPASAEFYDSGLALVHGLVLLPHARRRLRVDDLVRMSALARRCAPAPCVVLDDGMRLEVGPAGTLPPGARVIGPDGRIGTAEPA
jgi:hypothetical protein